MGGCQVSLDSLLISAPGETLRHERAMRFCELFESTEQDRPRILFGRNVYAKDLIQRYSIQGIVDDFSTDTHFEGVPIVRSADIPKHALVLALSGGRPLTVKDQLDALGLEHLDYFAFKKATRTPLRSIVFNEGFEEDLNLHRDRYEWVLSLLADEESRDSFRKLVSFRCKSDIELLRGFSYREPEQYFEPFLALQERGEVFYDVGCFDGYTSKEFIRHCPGYAAVHAFEPEAANVRACQVGLQSRANATVHPFGLSNCSATLRMAPGGSGSVMRDDGSQTIRVEPLDALGLTPPTLIKIDIEGAEPLALEGARQTIERHHPRLAIAVYHQTRDFAPMWQIPELILSIRNDYEVRLRHYTESIYETVMFFLPKRG